MLTNQLRVEAVTVKQGAEFSWTKDAKNTKHVAHFRNSWNIIFSYDHVLFQSKVEHVLCKDLVPLLVAAPR